MVALEVIASRSAREFVAALPKRWRGRFGLERWTIVGDDALRGPFEHLAYKPVALSVAQQDVLIRRVELPLASKFQIENLMQFEGARHIPLPLEKAYFDFRIVKHDVSKSRTVVELAIIRREAVETGLKCAAFNELKIEAIYLLTPNGPWLAQRPIGLNWRERWLGRRHRIQYLRAAVPILLLFMWILAGQDWAARLAANRDAAELVAQNRAAGIEPLRLRLAALNDKFRYLAIIRGRPSAARVTEEVARLLPDNAWLQELDIEDQTVRMLGTAQDATDLLRDFSASSLFTNVRFEAPLTQAVGQRGDQFDIMMTRR